MPDDVSRETGLAPPPEAAARIFAERLDLVAQYADFLATEGVVRGLIGPREAPRLWDRHLLNCGLLAPLLPRGASVADLGSGAGLPGLVLALARPDLSVTLVEPLLRRTTFLDEAVAALGLSHVEVVRGRAEQLPRGRRFDVVTARALAPLPRLLGWAIPLVAPGGCVLAMKGSSAGDEVHEAADDLDRWSATAEVLDLAVEGTTPTTVVRVAVATRSGIGWQPAARGRTRHRTRQRGPR
jgi:16S rRNA (guanine527-N7)-methyltransferase